MKSIALAGLLVCGFTFGSLSMAGEMPSAAAPEAKQAVAGEIPTFEKDFIKAINGFDKTKIIAQFGEPAVAEDVKVKDSGKVVASIWQYHFINTAEDGTYYQTTELDFIDDKVVMVVFMNHDGTEKNVPGQQYEVPAK